ncbi:MAG: ATP-binding protein [Lysobacterales bacterium]
MTVGDAGPDSDATAPTPTAIRPLAWYQGLGFRALLGLMLVSALLVTGTWYVLETRGKQLVLEESSRLIEQMGNNAVSGLLTRSSEIAALTRTVAAVSSELPKDVDTFNRTLPPLLDFGGDQAVAGGGYWPQPFAFDPTVERRSFFWGRDAQTHALTYFDDYNQPGNGYHNEEWYVPAQFVAPGSCYWSQSYMDPYSYQPMVTCTVAQWTEGKFNGVATVDLRLEGLAAFADAWRQKTGGYVFILDRNNRFITYPDADKVKRIGKDDKGARTEEFITAAEYAQAEPLFKPIADALQSINDEVIAAAATKLGPKLDQIATEIDQNSYQIDAEPARLVAAISADPLKERYSIERSTLARSFAMEMDPQLKTQVLSFVFQVPGSYWKLVVVKPLAEATAVATGISRSLLTYLGASAVLVVLLAFIFLNRGVIAPLGRSAKAMQVVGELIARRRYTELTQHHLDERGHNELAVLGHSFNELIDRVVDNEGKLAQVNVMLEQRVVERTAELSKALSELKASQLQLIQSEKMASLGQMVAGVAHEINTPLGYVKNNVLMAREFTERLGELIERSNALARCLADGNADEAVVEQTLAEMKTLAEALRDEGVRDDLDVLFKDTIYGVEQISEMVVNLRNFSRLDEAKVKHTQINECVESTLNIARNVLKNRVQVVKQLGEIPAVSCSPAQINQVLLNLINNAAHAVDQNGVLTISTSADSDNVHISVQDNGRGIDKDVLPKIFDPFFTTKKVGEGTGLGLSIVYKIVQQHGGRIRVSSKPGAGTRFVISLPIRESAPTAAA